MAHEFWISPASYHIAPGATIVADLRIGQNFEGPPFPFLPAGFTRFELVQGAQTLPVSGRIGDMPALRVPAPGPGLWIVVHRAADQVLRYDDPAKFAAFLEHKDLGWVQAEHQARGLPDTGFSERYARFAKSLIAVDAGDGADVEVGLETEILALSNPWTDDVTDGLRVRVLYKGKPRKDAQLEVFARDPEGGVTINKLRTDAMGEVLVPVRAGHEYLLDAVLMRPLFPSAPGAPVWESLWASLTFAVP